MAGYKVKESLLWRMKGGAAPVLEDTQHVTYPNLAQIENGFVQIANYICLTLKQCFLGDVLVVLTEKSGGHTYNIHTFTCLFVFVAKGTQDPGQRISTPVQFFKL